MLVGVDEIKWAKLQHAAGSAKDIPERLRLLDSDLPYDEFLKTLTALNTLIFDDGAWCSAAPHVVPFFCQLLTQCDDPRRVVDYLFILAGTIADTAYIAHSGAAFYFDIKPYDRHERVIRWTELRYTSQRPLRHHRLRLHIYDVLNAHLSYFLPLLHHTEPDIQLLTVFLVSHLFEYHTSIIPALMPLAESATEPALQGAAIWGLVRLMRSAEDAGLRLNAHQQLLLKWVTAEAHLLKRGAAALGYIALMPDQPGLGEYPRPILPRPVIEAIAEGLRMDLASLKASHSSTYDIDSLDLLPFQSAAAIVSKACQAIRQPFLWIDILTVLSAAPAPPALMHRCIHEMLDIAFERLILQHEIRTDTTTNAIVYGNWGSQYHAGQRLTAKQSAALKTVLMCDVFWQTPSNLLSFFYGLPDDRDNLRKLLAVSS